jgi:acyl-coenzyme A thioesterase PaaI-like protein
MPLGGTRATACEPCVTSLLAARLPSLPCSRSVCRGEAREGGGRLPSPAMQLTPGQMFITGLGVSYRAEGDGVVGRFEVSEHERVGGNRLVRAGVLATVADVVAGWGANRHVFPRIPLTVDLSVHWLRPSDRDVLDVTARVLKAGATTVVSEATFADPDTHQPAILSYVTFVVSPRPQDAFTQPLPERVQPSSLARPIMDDIGARVISPGVAELDRVPYVMQPAGTIQGGAVALLVELAAESIAGAPIADLEIRYLAAIRIGPARATAEVIAPGLARVEVRDVGRPDRLATIALARF